MHTAGQAARGRRRAVASVGALAIGLGVALVTGTAAHAADAKDVTGGGLKWGFKSSFRTYVGGAMNTLPAGQKITVTAPTQFDASGGGTGETLPYLFPATGGTYTDAANFTVETGGGVGYHFPAHGFDVAISDVRLVVADGTATLVADTALTATVAFGDVTPGTYGADDATIANVGSFTATPSGDGASVQVTASNVTLTAAGHAALPLYAAGDPLDSFTLDATLAAPAPTWTPQITVSQTSGFDKGAVSQVTVTGTGFDPAANVAAGQPLGAGAPAGVYVVFGRFADNWRPSQGAASAARPVTSQKWAMPEPSYTSFTTKYPTQAGAVTPLAADGSFSVTVDVKAATATSGNYGIYVYSAASNDPNADQEVFVPISFAGDLDVTVDVPTAPEPDGEFTWTIGGGSGAIALGQAQAGAAAFTASGALKQVTVTDTRKGSPAWSVNGQVGDFRSAAGSFDGKYLGWTPVLSENTVGAVAGAPVAPGAGNGLKAASTLASSPAGHAKGSVKVDATLDLSLPLSTPAGSYTGVLTLTAIG